MTYTQSFYDVHSELVKGVPAFEVLDPNETADHIRAGDDARVIALVADYLDVALEWVENEVKLSLPQRTLTLYLDEFPCSEIEVRFPPLQSVASIVYLDTAGDSTTLSASDYRVDTTGKPARITPAYGLLWPSTYCVTRAVTITATVGYTDATLVPACAKQAMRILVKSMWENGGAMCEGELEAVRRILDPIRWGGYL
jgi:uncharacterized phiE125 gp8 family phage protein